MRTRGGFFTLSVVLTTAPLLAACGGGPSSRSGRPAALGRTSQPGTSRSTVAGPSSSAPRSSSVGGVVGPSLGSATGGQVLGIEAAMRASVVSPWSYYQQAAPAYEASLAGGPASASSSGSDAPASSSPGPDQSGALAAALGQLAQSCARAASQLDVLRYPAAAAADSSRLVADLRAAATAASAAAGAVASGSYAAVEAAFNRWTADAARLQQAAASLAKALLIPQESLGLANA